LKGQNKVIGVKYFVDLINFPPIELVVPLGINYYIKEIHTSNGFLVLIGNDGGDNIAVVKFPIDISTCAISQTLSDIKAFIKKGYLAPDTTREKNGRLIVIS
jgi:hypothetical protein